MPTANCYGCTFRRAKGNSVVRCRHHFILAFGLLVVPILESAAAPPLGRLILEPAERQARDRQRQANPAFIPAGEGGEHPLEIVGELHSSGGRHRRWRDDGHEAPGMLRLPVGDRLFPATGRQAPLLGTGSLRIHRPGVTDGAR